MFYNLIFVCEILNDLSTFFYWVGERGFLSVASEKEIIKRQLFWKYAEGIQQGSSITMGDPKKKKNLSGLICFSIFPMRIYVKNNVKIFIGIIIYKYSVTIMWESQIKV